MAYKRNPMRSERIASLARYVVADALNPAMTASTQWFERTLDDSANKRISVAEGFLAVDAILSLVVNVVDGLVVNTAVIDRDLRRELPFMATENIMMDCAKRGGDRQELHEAIRTHSMEAARRVKAGGRRQRPARAHRGGRHLRRNPWKICRACWSPAGMWGARRNRPGSSWRAKWRRCWRSTRTTWAIKRKSTSDGGGRKTCGGQPGFVSGVLSGRPG